MKQYFIQSFSKGQVTIPKAVRTMLNIGDDFILKLEVTDGKIVAEPVVQNDQQHSYPVPPLHISAVFDMARTTRNNKQLTDAEMITIAKDEDSDTS